jgi:hypothetical protein
MPGTILLEKHRQENKVANVNTPDTLCRRDPHSPSRSISAQTAADFGPVCPLTHAPVAFRFSAPFQQHALRTKRRAMRLDLHSLPQKHRLAATDDNSDDIIYGRPFSNSRLSYVHSVHCATHRIRLKSRKINL